MKKSIKYVRVVFLTVFECFVHKINVLSMKLERGYKKIMLSES